MSLRAELLSRCNGYIKLSSNIYPQVICFLISSIHVRYYIDSQYLLHHDDIGFKLFNVSYTD